MIGFIQEWFNIRKSMHTLYHVNILKEKNHINFSQHEEKLFDKIQNSFMIKTYKYSRVQISFEGCFLTWKKVYAKIIINITFKGKK